MEARARLGIPQQIKRFDPDRFADLVTQLVYGFRNWERIEPKRDLENGHRIEMRAVEASQDLGNLNDIEERRESYLRLWHVQCTSESRIGPKTVDEIAPELVQGNETPYGVVLAAPTSFSRQTRETFRRSLSSAGVRETHLWGLDELENFLHQPENDQLLFAYFGVSLQVRRRRLATDLQRRFSTKRQLAHIFGTPDDPVQTHGLLIRDPEAPGYPTMDDLEGFSDDVPPWIVAEFGGWGEPDHLPIVAKRFDAWFKPDEGTYDYVPLCDHTARNYNLYRTQHDVEQTEVCDRIRQYMRTIPEDERAYFELRGWIHFDDILLVDDIGDAHFDPPHILASRTARSGFFRRVEGFILQRYGSDTRFQVADGLERKPLFPDPIPEIESDPPTKLVF